MPNQGTSAARRAVVIGGSMGGLFTALLLRRAGWRTCSSASAANSPAGARASSPTRSCSRSSGERG